MIINVGAGSSSGYDLNGILLSGGITSDHVLVNVDATGNLQAGPNGSQGNVGNPVVNAIVIDNAGATNLNSITINGSLFCTTGPGDCQYVSNAFLNQQPFVAGSTPEPGTWLLGVCGVAGIAGLKRFRRSQESVSKSN